MNNENPCLAVTIRAGRQAGNMTVIVRYLRSVFGSYMLPNDRGVCDADGERVATLPSSAFGPSVVAAASPNPAQP